MKICTRTHEHPSFGTIPAGSLWDDDSPYVELDRDAFEPVDTVPEPEPEPPKPLRKSNLSRKAGV